MSTSPGTRGESRAALISVQSEWSRGPRSSAWDFLWRRIIDDVLAPELTARDSASHPAAGSPDVAYDRAATAIRRAADRGAANSDDAGAVALERTVTKESSSKPPRTGPRL